MPELQGTFQSEPRQVGEMRRFVTDLCQEFWNCGLEVPAVQELQLAVSEVATNIVLHGCEGRADEPIRLTVRSEEGRLFVEFRYHGCEFRPTTVAPPDFEGRAESGYGQYLIHRCVDGFEYQRSPAGECRIRLTKLKPSSIG